MRVLVSIMVILGVSAIAFFSGLIFGGLLILSDIENDCRIRQSFNAGNALYDCIERKSTSGGVNSVPKGDIEHGV